MEVPINWRFQNRRRQKARAGTTWKYSWVFEKIKSEVLIYWFADLFAQALPLRSAGGSPAFNAMADELSSYKN